jgi:hypothetical protein
MVGGDGGSGFVVIRYTATQAPVTIQETLTTTEDGNVGIGTVNPTVKLDVVGDVAISGTVSGGNIIAKYQDIAEWVPSRGFLPPGTVVVLDASRPNAVEPSSSPYDARVAGVISPKPGLVLGEASVDKSLVATTGRVKVRVDASAGAIMIGDLLVTSDKPGLAMRSEAISLAGVPIHRPGTILGKALEPLANGQGEILVLLSLQ